MNNFYDNIQLNIEKAHNEINVSGLRSHNESYLNCFYKYLFNKRLYEKLIDAGLIRWWFNEFSAYWTSVLHCRPLKFHDFFYLYSNYRVKFQNVEVAENSANSAFLNAWQRPENIYLTFGAVYKFALNPFVGLNFLSYIKNDSHILEYGCGLAPIVTSLIKNKKAKCRYTIADIRNHTYHYAKFRLKQHEVNFVDIYPKQLPKLDNSYDVVFLMTVLEHLPDPLDVIHFLNEKIKEKGYLIFDYIQSEGTGLDTVESVRQRSAVLQYISSHFNVIYGKINFDKSMGTTVVQKK